MGILGEEKEGRNKHTAEKGGGLHLGKSPGTHNPKNPAPGDGHMRTVLLLVLMVRAEKMMVGREKTSCCEGALHDFNCCFYITLMVLVSST